MAVNDLCGYIHLRNKSGKVEVLTTHGGSLVWIDYSTMSSNESIYFKGKGMQDRHAREITDEIVISRANGYMVKVLEIPLDYETNLESKPKEYILTSLGKSSGLI